MNRKTEFQVSLVIIAVIILAVYYPTFSHLLRGETYTYFMDTAGDNSATSLVRNWWNYESVRTFDPGDRLLFRPLLFATVGIEKALFGINYTYWRIAAFSMHLLASLCLFRFLWRMKAGILALLATILFATSYICLNTILYEQIASYALFTALLLTGLYYVYQGIERKDRRSLIISSICMLLASFFHETGILFTILFLGYFWWKQEQLGVNQEYCNTLFWGITFIFSIIYFPSKFINPARFTDIELRNIVSWDGLAIGVNSTKLLAGSWLQQVTLPALFILKPISNLRSYSVDIIKNPQVIPLILNWLSLIAIGTTFLFTKAKEKTKQHKASFAVLLAIMLGIFLLANSLFRAKSHGVSYLIDHNFNIYIGVALFITLVYTLISLRKLSPKHTGIIALALVVLITFSAPKVFMLNSDIKTAEQPVRAYFQSIDKFINLHQGDQDFSFNAVINHPVQEELKFAIYKVPNDDLKFVYYNFTIPEVLYWAYWNEDNPKYILQYYPNNDELKVKVNG